MKNATASVKTSVFIGVTSICRFIDKASIKISVMINSKIHYHNFDEYGATIVEYGGPWNYLDNGIFTEDDLSDRAWVQICSPYSK